MPTLRDIALLRLRNQHLIGRGFASAAEAVGWFGAVQSQDFSGAKWALGQRMKRASDAAIEDAFARGEILRTHVLRPTWHFVLPADIRWMLALTAPRVRATLRPYDKRLGLDPAVLARALAAVSGALRGGNFLTRNELARVLAENGIEARGQRLGHIAAHAELDAIVCSGPRRGKQFTYALLNERAPAAKPLSRERALSELAARYFTSHGPALAQDFAWWSGLTLADAKFGIELAQSVLSDLTVDGRTYWHAGNARPPKLARPVVHLLPNFDEQLIAYKERSAAFDRERIAPLGRREYVLGNHLITLDGRVIGGWRRAAARPPAPLELTLLTRLRAAEKRALRAAEAKLAKFLA